MKIAAYRAVKLAIKRGELNRPDKCSRCGAPDRPCSDGRTRIHAHHPDYSKPLDVEWLCCKCHRADTPLPKNLKNPVLFGMENGFSKLTESDVLMILKSPESGVKLAKRLCVDPTTVHRVRRGKHWSHIRAAELDRADEKEK